MNQIIDYVTQHSAWFVGGMILVVLAVIGYYADKSNFGQGKNAEPEKQKTEKDISKTRLMDVAVEEPLKNAERTKTKDKTENKGKQNVNLEDGSEKELAGSQMQVEKSVNNNKDSNITDSLTSQVEKKPIEFLEAIEAKVYKNLPKEKEIVEEITKLKEATNKISKPAKTKKTKTAARDAAFDRFEKEFESLLPKKDIINADLLSDIDELELGKTQKIKFNEVPDLDDIDLPKIKKSVNEDQDIWKF